MAVKTKKYFINGTAGLWGDRMEGRIDIEQSRNAARQLENYWIRPNGELERRQGTVYSYRGKGGAFCILTRLQYNASTGYVIEAGEDYFRFYKDRAIVRQIVTATAATKTGGGPYTITYTYAGHTLAVGDTITTTGFTPSGYNVTDAVITAVTSTTFSIEVTTDPTLPVTVLGDVQMPFEVTTTYAEADLLELEFTPINDVIFITHEDYMPAQLIRLTATTFELKEILFDLPPFLDENVTDIWLTPASASGSSISLTADAPAWTNGVVYKEGTMRKNGGNIYRANVTHLSSALFATDSDKWDLQEVFATTNVTSGKESYYRLGQRKAGVEVSMDLTGGVASNGDSSSIFVRGTYTFVTDGNWEGVVSLIRTDPQTGEDEVLYKGRSVDGNRNLLFTGEEEVGADYYLNLADTATPSGSPGEATAYLENPSQIIYGYCKALTRVSATEVTVQIINNFTNTSKTTIWAEGAWSDRRGYPKSCALFEERMNYAGSTSYPLRVWSSKSGDYYNFDYGDGSDADAFFRDIASPEQNPIEWIVAAKQLIIGTGKEYGIMGSGSEDLPMTPSNVGFRVQEAKGFNYIKPEIVGQSYIGVERNGRRLREINYRYDQGLAGGYIAGDLNRLNDDITASGVVSIAYAQQRYPYIMAVMSDGSMGVLAYNREEQIAGWSKFTTDGEFVSVTTIRGTYDDEIWVTVKRNINGSDVYYVEYFNPDEWTNLEDAIYLDSAVSFEQSYTVSTASWSSGTATYTLSAAHNLQVGDLITVTGVTPTGYNVDNAEVTAVPGSTQVSVAINSGPGTYSAGGTLIANRINGLRHLNSETVQILGDADNKPTNTVDSDGETTADVAVNTAQAGLAFNSVWQPLRFDLDEIYGASMGQKKRISHLVFRGYKTIGFSMDNGIREYEVPFNSTEDLYGVPLSPKTDERRVDFPQTYGAESDNHDPTFIIKQTKPYPQTIIAVTVFFSISG